MQSKEFCSLIASSSHANKKKHEFKQTLHCNIYPFKYNPDLIITGCVNFTRIQSPIFDQVAVLGMFQQQKSANSTR